MSMATKFVRTVIYSQELLSAKSFVPLVTWSHELTWQIKYAISPSAEDLLEDPTLKVT